MDGDQASVDKQTVGKIIKCLWAEKTLGTVMKLASVHAFLFESCFQVF